MLENYNLNHYQKKPSGDDLTDWIYQNSDLAAPDADVDDAWTKVSSKLTEKSSKNFVINRFLRVAAVVTVLAVAGFVVFQNLDNENPIELAADDSIKTVTFSDGSKAVLNLSSSLLFNQEFDGERSVDLSGEAYFDIVSDDRPFIVKMGDVSVQVLGTAFNLKENADKITLFVDHGLVLIGDEDGSKKIARGQMAVYDKVSKQLTVSDTAPANLMSWRNGKFNFDDTPLVEATELLGKYYKVDFQIDAKMEKCRVTANFINDSLNKVIKVLETILSTESTKKGTVISFAGKGC